MSFTDTLAKNIKFIIIFPVLLAGIVVGLSAFKQPLYRSSASLLVVQKQGTDISAQETVNSAEQIADMLSRVVDSESFRATVLNSGEVSVALSSKPWERSRQWHKIVKTKNITDTGILVIDVYQPSSSQATKLAAAIEKSLISDGYDYVGANRDSVAIRELNPPAPTNDKPANPNLPLNGVVGWLSGILIASSLMLLFPGHAWFQSQPKAPKAIAPAPQAVPKPVSAPIAPVSAQSQTPASGTISSAKLTEVINSIATQTWNPEANHPMASQVKSNKDDFAGFQPEDQSETQKSVDLEKKRDFVSQAQEFSARKQF